MADLFDGYPLGQQWDEMFAAPAQPRSPYTGLFSSLQPMSGEELAARADVLSQTYRDAGVTFAHAGEEQDRKSTRLNSSHANISYAVFCLKKNKQQNNS